MYRTYEVYAANMFLGYEYGYTDEEVLEKTIELHGEPSQWQIEAYRIIKILWPEEK